jgi:hypothetical protein
MLLKNSQGRINNIPISIRTAAKLFIVNVCSRRQDLTYRANTSTGSKRCTTDIGY